MSDTPKHTPGPWLWTGQYGRSNLFGADSELVLFEVGGLYCKGDALLIAAAPEMLEALKEARNFVGQFVRYEPPKNHRDTLLLDKIEAAIAKAEGRQP
jgi:hypothetical protein